MLLFHESGIAYITNWEWVSTGEYPIINFGSFVFAERFYIKSGEAELVEGVDYIRILRSKDVFNTFGVEMFGGVILLSPVSTTLDIYAVDSCPLSVDTEVSVSVPEDYDVYSPIEPMDGSHDNVIDIINELTALIPYIEGVTLPQYVFTTLGRSIASLEYTNIEQTLDIQTFPSGQDEAVRTNLSSARSDFLPGADSIPLDSYQLT